jgi:hypothetical protein
MARMLRNNPRKFQEPFKLQMIKEDTSSGMSKLVVEQQVILFGSILNNVQFSAASNIEAGTNQISIKIMKQYLNIKPKDRVIYNGAMYSIITISNDNYSAAEMILTCKYESIFAEDPSKKGLETALEAILYG